MGSRNVSRGASGAPRPDGNVLAGTFGERPGGLAAGLPGGATDLRLPSSLDVITVPGLHGSGPAHWQSRWESQFPAWRRVEQDDWSRPSLHLWAERVADTISSARTASSAGAVLVAHSFGCLATLRQAMVDPEGIAGALLVAPADPDKFGVGPLLPTYRLPFPTLVVASRNDPWMSQRTAFSWGTLWGSELHDAGALGHINADSGLDAWPDGLSLLGALIQRIERQAGAVDAAERPAAWETGVEVQPNFPYI